MFLLVTVQMLASSVHHKQLYLVSIMKVPLGLQLWKFQACTHIPIWPKERCSETFSTDSGLDDLCYKMFFPLTMQGVSGIPWNSVPVTDCGVLAKDANSGSNFKSSMIAWRKWKCRHGNRAACGLFVFVGSSDMHDVRWNALAHLVMMWRSFAPILCCHHLPLSLWWPVLSGQTACFFCRECTVLESCAECCST